MAKVFPAAPVAVSANVSGLTDLAAKLHRMGPAAEAALPARMQEAGEIVATRARSKAPGSVGSDIVTEVAGPGLVRVRATSTKAIAIENAGKGYVRHPVYVPRSQLPGPPGSWTSKNSHPAYLHPAFEETKPEVYETVIETIHDAWVEVGMGT